MAQTRARRSRREHAWIVGGTEMPDPGEVLDVGAHGLDLVAQCADVSDCQDGIVVCLGVDGGAPPAGQPEHSYANMARRRARAGVAAHCADA